MAGSWWSVEFAPGQNYGQLQDQFTDLFVKAGGPRGAALFVDDQAGGRCTLFFTPAAAILAKVLIAAHGGKACSAPAKATAFLVGHDQDRTMVPRRQPGDRH